MLIFLEKYTAKTEHEYNHRSTPLTTPRRLYIYEGNVSGLRDVGAATIKPHPQHSELCLSVLRFYVGVIIRQPS